MTFNDYEIVFLFFIKKKTVKTKSLSFENYIKYAFWGRTWYGVENDSTHYDTESSISIETVLFGDMQYYTNYRSTLSTAENYKTTLGPFTRHGSYTYYPDYVNNSCDIIAENGFRRV